MMDKIICAIKAAIYVLSMVVVTSLGAMNANRAALDEALFRAIDYGTLDEVIDLLVDGADVNAQRKNCVTEGQKNSAFTSLTPLHVAISRLSVRFIKLFLLAGAKLDVVDEVGRTPLQHAVALRSGFLKRGVCSFDSVVNNDVPNLENIIKLLEKAEAKGAYDEACSGAAELLK